jgi:hypothetical protein
MNQYVRDRCSCLPLQQPLEKVEAVAITLQLKHFARLSVFPAELLGNEQPEVSRDALDACTRATLRFERDDLIAVP